MRERGRKRGEMGKEVVTAGGHYRSLAEGGTLPAEAASHWAAGGIPCKARPTAPARGSWRPLLAAAKPLLALPRVLRPSCCSACSAGYWEVVREGRSGDGEGGVRAGNWSGSPFFPCTLRLGFLTWGLQGSFPVRTAPACPSAAGLCPYQSWWTSLPSSQSGPSRPLPQQLGGREGATAGCCWAVSGGLEPSARSRHLEPRQRAGCGCKGRGLAAQPKGGKGQGSERGSGPSA